jgi:hypothetical protein
MDGPCSGDKGAEFVSCQLFLEQKGNTIRRKKIVGLLGNRVVSTSAERIAAKQAQQAEPRTSDHAIFFYSLDGINGTGGGKTTGGR